MRAILQANGAEMLRLACLYLAKEGIRVVAPVHDALLVEAPLAELDEAVARTQTIMKAASAQVLNGFELNSDAKVVRYPGRYMDPRVVGMWNTMMGLLAACRTGFKDLDPLRVFAGSGALQAPVGSRMAWRGPRLAPAMSAST